MTRRFTRGLGALTGVLALGAAAVLAAPAADARTAAVPHRTAAVSSALGSTTVTTAPGIATTLLGAGILPLPVLPRTGVRLSFDNGLRVAYTFPITSSTADLASASGDINHAGGIWFVGRRSTLEVGRFDIDLAAGKVFATQVNWAPARAALLDLDLSGLRVSTDHGRTVLSGIGLNLDPAGATALNHTFGTSLPTDGSLRFGSATVVLR
jgi:hypothetical protein